jgi:hypothetical protein
MNAKPSIRQALGQKAGRGFRQLYGKNAALCTQFLPERTS